MKHPTQKHHRILVVEDDPSIRRALERAFRSAGYSAEFAITLQDGLSKLNGQQVLLADLQLPDGSGTALLEKVRRDGKSMHVAIYSGLNNGPEIVKASGQTPDAFFAKPVDFDRLLDWLANVLKS